jgi:hypothetical protein
MKFPRALFGLLASALVFTAVGMGACPQEPPDDDLFLADAGPTGEGEGEGSPGEGEGEGSPGEGEGEGTPGEGEGEEASPCEGIVLVTDQGDLDAIADCEVIVGDLLIVASNLARVVLSDLQRIEGGLTISDNALLTSAGLPSLTDVTTDVVVARNTVLTSASFPDLLSVGGSFQVEQNPVLISATAGELNSVGRDVIVDGNPEMGIGTSLPELLAVETLRISNNATMSLPGMTGLQTAAFVVIENNPELCDLFINSLLARLNADAVVTNTNNGSACN